MTSAYNMRGDEASKMTPWMKLRAVLTIFGGLLIHLAIGAQYTFGNVMPYLISYLKYQAGESNVRNVDGLWFNAANPPLQVVAFVLGGVLYRRFGARITATIGAVIYSASTFLTYFAVQKSFVALAFTQFMMGTFGITIAYGSPVAVAMEWFPQRPGLAGGIILAGFGGSASIFNLVITYYINPDNLSPDVKEGSERYFSDVALLNRVPTCYFILGGIYSAMQIIGVLLLFSPTSSDQTKPEIVITNNKINNTNFDQEGRTENKNGDASVMGSIIENQEKREGTPHINNGDTSIKDSSIENHIEMSQSKSTGGVEEGHAKSEKISSEGNNQTDRTVLQLIKQMVMSRNFYIFSIILFSVGYGNLTLTTLYKAYGQTFILDDHFMALVGSLSSVFNCVGRPFWGAIMDRFGFKVTIQCITAGTACLLLTILASEWVGKPIFLIWVCAIYFCACGTYSTFPAILSKLYGVSNLGITYGFVRIATIITGIISAAVGTSLRDVIGWHGVYLLGGGVTAIGFVASVFFMDEDSKQNRKD